MTSLNEDIIVLCLGNKEHQENNGLPSNAVPKTCDNLVKRPLSPCYVCPVRRRVIFLVLVWHLQCATSYLYCRRISCLIPNLHDSRRAYYVTRSFPNNGLRIHVNQKLWLSKQTVGVDYNRSSLRAPEIESTGDHDVFEMNNRKRNASGLLREGRLLEVLQILEKMLFECQRVRFDQTCSSSRFELMSELIDDVFQEFVMVAFAPVDSRRSKSQEQRLELGMRALQLQLLSSSALAHPYDTVPRSTLLMALRTLTTYMEVHGNELITCTPVGTAEESDSCTVMDTSDAAFRILQRLVTGVGVRPGSTGRNRVMAEKDFHRVLIAFTKVGKVSEAHRMVKLQERHAGDFTSDKPAVAYSILIKGYGRLRDLENVEKTLSNFCHQLQSRKYVEPDVIFLNSLIDAFINCRALNKAEAIFAYMKLHSNQSKGSRKEDARRPIMETDSSKLLLSLFPGRCSCPAPNHRTYNTMLKGYAENGTLGQALSLAYEMERLALWDSVTTNTIVHAAVQRGELELAESILGNFTTTARTSRASDNKEPAEFDVQSASRYQAQIPPTRSRSRNKQVRHPNVEAYTELLDAYGKASQLEKAMSIMQIMRKRGVEPNEFTYTCVIGALARHQKVDQARRLIAYMETSECNIELTAVTYNSFITGLVASDFSQQEAANLKFDECVNEAVHVLQRMMERGVNPDAITISVLIESFSRCSQPRVDEAKALVQKLEQGGIITRTNPKIATSLIRTCSLAGDLKGAADAFRKIQQPDVVALNAFLDACCRCNMLNMALQTFEHFFQRKRDGSLLPDIITYSVLIGSLLNSKTLSNVNRAQQMYTEMKSLHHIWPDNVLIDVILKAMVKTERQGLSKDDIVFLITVISDAESLTWEEGQLDRRKRAVRAVIVSRINELGEEKSEIMGMLNIDSKGAEDELFLRKGWNKVDSSFRLWSHPSDDNKETFSGAKHRRNEVDEFFESKGWNVFSSGFRII